MMGVEMEWIFEQRGPGGQLEAEFAVYATATDCFGFRHVTVANASGAVTDPAKALGVCMMLADLIELDDPNQAMKLRNGAAVEYVR